MCKRSVWHPGQLCFVQISSAFGLTSLQCFVSSLPVLPREASRGCEGSGDLTLRLHSPQLLPRFANLRETGGMTSERERGRLKEAQRGGVELFQAACELPLFDHYIIASHAAPAVHS